METAAQLETSLRALVADATGLSDVRVDAAYTVASSLFESGRHADAADLFRLVVVARPKSPRGWIGLAACHEAVDDRDRALELYRVGMFAPDDPVLRAYAAAYYARLRLAMNEVDEARSALAELDDEVLEAARADDILSPVLASLKEASSCR